MSWILPFTTPSFTVNFIMVIYHYLHVLEFHFQGESSEEVLLPGPVQESFLFATGCPRPWRSFLPSVFWAKMAELEIVHGNLVNGIEKIELKTNSYFTTCTLEPLYIMFFFKGTQTFEPANR